MNVWHDVHYGKNAPEIVTAIIEIPNKSRVKYEIDKDTGLLSLDRVLFSSMHYPANYGFIPQTLGDDNDPVDILVLSYADMPSLTLANARPIGVMHMIDGGEGDDKIIAIASDDITVNHIQSIDDLPKSLLAEIEYFFARYKDLEKKSVQINGYSDKTAAQKIISAGIKNYNQKFISQTS